MISVKGKDVLSSLYTKVKYRPGWLLLLKSVQPKNGSPSYFYFVFTSLSDFTISTATFLQNKNRRSPSGVVAFSVAWFSIRFFFFQPLFLSIDVANQDVFNYHNATWIITF